MQTVSIPTWALWALIYGDYDGLTSEESQLVQEFQSQYEVTHCDSEEFFSRQPEFGLASMCVEATVNHR